MPLDCKTRVMSLMADGKERTIAEIRADLEMYDVQPRSIAGRLRDIRAAGHSVTHRFERGRGRLYKVVMTPAPDNGAIQDGEQ